MSRKQPWSGIARPMTMRTRIEILQGERDKKQDQIISLERQLSTKQGELERYKEIAASCAEERDALLRAIEIVILKNQRRNE